MSLVPRSLGAKLAIGLSAGIVVAWLLTIASAAFVVREELDEILDSSIEETAERLLPLAVQELKDRRTGIAERINRVTDREEYLTYVIRSTDGKIVLHSHDADLSVFDGPRSEGFRDTESARIYYLTSGDSEYSIEVAEARSLRNEAVLETIQVLVMPLFLVVPALLIGVIWFIKRSMRPVTLFHDEVARRDGSDMSPVSNVGLPSELFSIAEAVNGLLGRLRRTLEAERSFTANSAHELRTPIAACLVQTQRLIREAPEGHVRERALQIEAQLKRLTKLSEKLMQLARAEGGGLITETANDLPSVLAFLVDEIRLAGADGRIMLELPEGPEKPLKADPDAYALLARNLIENALIYGESDQPVRVTMFPDGGLRVTNAGATVPPDTLPLLTRRFMRGNSKIEGSGLGLAIADAIAKGLGGRLALHSPARGQNDGFEAEFLTR